MSYCRWSSMDHACDLYVYSDVNGGYTCHVANGKRVAGEPCPSMPEKWWELPVEEFMAAAQKQSEWVDKTKVVPIGLPHDGESYYSLDRDTMVDTLKMLKEAGYKMPDDLIETIASEDEE